ncbi:MAG: tripartite tricarboxylate transporter permease [Salinarimonadaceae bacterium]|nr:MAG: tripartite tricarboxylate transporter permease [Salinarimonadaceae bacterium]
MELFTVGFPVAFSFDNLLYCFVGVFLGTMLGALPGIGALAAISMLLPITFYLEPTTGIVMLAGVYYGAEYGGSTASILLNLPGTPSNAVTCLDGYPMAQNGRAGVALFTTTIASFVGGVVGILMLLLLTPFIVGVALAFGSAEYFSVMVLGLIAASTISQGSAIKGLSMVALGVLLSTVGADVNTGIERYSFGFLELINGINIIILAMGLFGVSEIISSANALHRNKLTANVSLASMIPSREEVRRSAVPMLRGSAVGCVFGPLPGTGPSLAAFLSYALEKRVSSRPEAFGRGAIEGIASPEAANNAAVQTAFIPALSLGIPGTATIAVMIGALMAHGISPGPRMVSDHPDLFWGLIASFWIGNVMLLVLNIPFIGLWVRILTIPYHYLYPAILTLICVGAYSINNNAFDVFLVLVIGAFGHVMRLLRFEPAPLIVGFILGSLLEEHFRRALLLGRGDFMVFMERPISAVFLGLATIMVAWIVGSSIRSARRSTLARRLQQRTGDENKSPLKKEET